MENKFTTKHIKKKINEIKKARKHQSNPKRNKELEISHSENCCDKQPEEEEDHNQTSKRSPPHEIQNYLYNYVDLSNSENDNSRSDADQAGKTDALANLWLKIFNSAAKSPHILPSNFQKQNDFPNILSLSLKVNPDKRVLILTDLFRNKLRKLCKSILNKEIPVDINDI